VPPNYGTDYANKFAGLFTTVAQAHKAAVVPFFLRVWLTDRTRPACSSPTAFTLAPKRIRKCWPTCGQSSKSCCVRDSLHESNGQCALRIGRGCQAKKMQQ